MLVPLLLPSAQSGEGGKRGRLGEVSTTPLLSLYVTVSAHPKSELDKSSLSFKQNPWHGHLAMK